MTQGEINYYLKLYAENKDFKRYVDRYCIDTKHQITVEEAVQHVIVRVYADQLIKRQSETDVPVKTEIKAGCGGC